MEINKEIVVWRTLVYGAGAADGRLAGDRRGGTAGGRKYLDQQFVFMLISNKPSAAEPTEG
jgi:hypothetical protein